MIQTCVRGQGAYRYSMASVGTYTVSHGFSFATVAGTANMYDVKCVEGNAFVKPTEKYQTYCKVICLTAPAIVDIIPIHPVQNV